MAKFVVLAIFLQLLLTLTARFSVLGRGVAQAAFKTVTKN